MFRPFLIPIGSKKYAIDGKALFTKSMKTLIAIDPTLENYEIPEGVTAIEEYAFYESSIKNIIIPESVTKIGSAAFSGCRNLRKVSFKGKKVSLKFLHIASMAALLYKRYHFLRAYAQ